MTYKNRREVGTFLLAGLGDALLQAPPAAAQAGRRSASIPVAVEAQILEHMRQHKIPGLSIAAVRNETTLIAAGFGLADIRSKRKCEASTVYNIGSVSKQFLASGLMVLVQDGKVGLDDPAARYLGDAPPSWNGITVRHLLSHTAGLVRNPPPYDKASKASIAEHIRKSYPTALMFEPGTGFSYSNLGYFVLGEVVEKVTRQSWGHFLVEHLFKKEALVKTGIGEVARGGQATGYHIRSEQPVLAQGYLVPRPSGGVHSTVVDLLKWDATLRSDALLSQKTRETMWSPTQLKDGRNVPYGLGWRIRSKNGQRTLLHSGHVPGFGALFMRQPQRNFALAILANLDAPQANLGALAPGILRALNGNTESLAEPTEAEPIELE